jgi:hypothetical protein
VTGQPKTAISIYNFVSEYALKLDSGGIVANEADSSKSGSLRLGKLSQVKIEQQAHR